MDQVNPRLPRRAAILIGMLAALAAQCAGQPPERLSESEVKAAFLLNFTRFIEWPRTAFEEAGSVFNICILGQDPFQSVLDQVVAGEAVNGRKVVVQRIKHVPEPKACQVLFIGKSEKDIRGIVAGLGPGVLTVGDQPGFLRDGGIIGFTLEGHHVRFDINQRAASSASLVISARLLNVARAVEK